MSTVLVWRERLQRLYAGYSTYIIKAAQFVMGLLVFGMINSNIGFMKIASSVFCTVGLAVICTFFPMIVMVTVSAALILMHFYTLSMPIAGVSLAIFLLMYIFYFRFTPKKAWLVLVAGLAFGLKIPFVIPVVFGLLGMPVWIVPAACGIISYYMLSFAKASSSAIKSADKENVIESAMNFLKQIMTNKEMWLMVMTVTIGILLVHLIRTRAVDNAWKIASATGAVACVAVASAGNIVLDAHISYGVVIVSALLGAGAGLLLEIFFFSVDYTKTENIQFEDDEYYYYVKAVPKVGVAVPEKKVKRITGQKQQAADDDFLEYEEAEQDIEDIPMTADEKNTEEILLTRSLSKELGLDQNTDPRE